MSEEKNSTAVEYAVPEDRKRLLLYTILYGLLTLVLMLAAVVFYNLTVKYTLGWLGVLLAITGVWYAGNALTRYLNRYYYHLPVCEFRAQELSINTLAAKPKVIAYRNIKSAWITHGKVSVNLFVRGEGVDHPSGYWYIGVVYPFQKEQLAGAEEQIRAELKKHSVPLKETGGAKQ
jgi:hypothetical protein